MTALILLDLGSNVFVDPRQIRVVQPSGIPGQTELHIAGAHAPTYVAGTVDQVLDRIRQKMLEAGIGQ